MTKLVIKSCPTCGSRNIRRVRRDVEGVRGGQRFVARDIEVEECPDCGERLFGPEALDAIASKRPRSAESRAKRRKSA